MYTSIKTIGIEEYHHLIMLPQVLNANVMHVGYPK